MQYITRSVCKDYNDDEGMTDTKLLEQTFRMYEQQMIESYNTKHIIKHFRIMERRIEEC